jgi:predicted secreted Zn-dependent protease
MINKEKYKKKDWVVGKAHPRWTSSVVVTFVQVIHKDTTCPASKLRTNLFVQILANRAQRDPKNADGESNRIFGLTIASVVVT